MNYEKQTLNFLGSILRSKQFQESSIHFKGLFAFHGLMIIGFVPFMRIGIQRKLTD